MNLTPPLHQAALNGDIAEVQRLLTVGYCVDDIDGSNTTPLMMAAQSDSHEIVLDLMQVIALEALIWLEQAQGQTVKRKEMKIHLGKMVGKYGLWYCNFCAGIGPLQLDIVLVQSLFKLCCTAYLNVNQ